MRILIDLQSAQTKASGYRGVGRYSRAIVKGFIKSIEKNDEVYIALNGFFRDSCRELKDEFMDYIPEDHIKVWNWYPDIPPAYNRKMEEYEAPNYFHEWFLHQFNADIIWSLNFQEGLSEEGVVTSLGQTDGKEILVGTLYDLTPLLDEKTRPGKEVEKWYNTMLGYCKKCDALLTCSEFSKGKIHELLKYDIDRVVVATPGIDRNKFCLGKAENKKDNFILYIGGASEYKNVKKLIQAFGKLPEKLINQYSLVLAGKEVGDCREELLLLAKESNVEHRIVIKGYLEDDEMIDLMRRCSVFVFPSIAEGFGMPPAEAISCGALALVSNTTSLPEVVGDMRATFDPYDESDIAKKIENILLDKELANEILKQERLHIEQFDWEEDGRNVYAYFKKMYERQDDKNEFNNKNDRPVLTQKYGDDDIYLRKIAKSYADSRMFNRTRKICVDLSAVVVEDYVSGIQRVCNALTENFKAIFAKDEEVELIPVYSEVGKNLFIVCDYQNGKYVKRKRIGAEELIQFCDGDVLIMPDLHLQNAITKQNYLTRLIDRGVKVYTLLYDLIPVNFPEFYSPAFSKEFEEYLMAISRLSGVVAISKATLNDYIFWKSKNEIITRKNFIETYFYLGCDVKKANPSSRKEGEDFSLIKRFKEKYTFLMVGTIEPRKMHQQVFEAMEILWKRGMDINLVFVGRYGWKMEKFEQLMKMHNEYEKHFFWLENVSDEFLEQIYQVASAVIVASVTEGFGLPIIEAAYYGKKLILRDIPVFREIAGENAFYFQTQEADELADRIIEWIKLESNGGAPKSDSIEIKSWEESAKVFLQQVGLL